MREGHIVKSFDEALRALDDAIVRMGGLCERQLGEAVRAVIERDSFVAEAAIASDKQIDALEREIDDMVVRTLALRQPMAVDLRQVIGALKIATTLERIGDYAKNVAKRAITLAQVAPVPPAYAFSTMGQFVQKMLRDVLDAYAQRDVARGDAVWARDQELDNMYSAVFRELLTYMAENPRNITACTHLLFIAKNIERIGDHATNVAEMLHFLVTGKVIGAERPKGEATSSAVVRT
jgi:phosphate transport system protein